MKKVFRYTACGLFGIILVAFICCAIPKNSTCDFRGYVEEIQTDKQDACIWITISEATNENSHIKLKVTEKTAIKNLDGNGISADQIQIRNMLDTNVHGEKADDTYYQANWVKIYK